MSEAKEYLEKIREQDKNIEKKMNELACLDSLAKRITQMMNTTGGGASGNKDKLGCTMDKFIDLRDEINRDVDILVDMKREAYQILFRVKNENYYKVLEMHYLKYMSFEQIAVKMNCSKRWAEKLNGRALEVFGRLMGETVRNSSQ